MNAHLFVYGSLMSTARHRMGERLRAEARLIGPATMQGRLYRVSWYPGVSESTDPEQRVHGELYALDTPSHALAWLDAYEGVAPGSRGVRRVHSRRTAGSAGLREEVTAWVYLYCKDVSQLPLVADGRWTAASG